MNMEKTAGVSGRIKICSFATMVKGMKDRGIMLRSKSDAIWNAVEMLSIMYTKGGMEEFTDIREAVLYLDSIGLSLQSNERGKRSVIAAKIVQDAEDDYGVDYLTGMVAGRKTKGIMTSLPPDREMYDIVAKKMREMGREPISYEQYLLNKNKPLPQGEEDNSGEDNSVDIEEFEKKEKEKSAALKAGLANAMESMKIMKNVAME